MSTERVAALCLVSAAAILSTVLTNDVALFVIVPLTLGLCRITALPATRLIVFEALAVNAGSALTPIGNPQNLFLWQLSGSSFAEFTWHMAPLVAVLSILLLVLTALVFADTPLQVEDRLPDTPLDRPLLWVALAMYLPFLVLTDRGDAAWACAAVAAVVAGLRPRVLARVDWGLLLVFVLMFIDLRLVAGLDAGAVGDRQAGPGRPDAAVRGRHRRLATGQQRARGDRSGRVFARLAGHGLRRQRRRLRLDGRLAGQPDRAADGERLPRLAGLSPVLAALSAGGRGRGLRLAVHPGRGRALNHRGRPPYPRSCGEKPVAVSRTPACHQRSLSKATMTKQTLSFQAEVKQILHLVTHSLYSNKEIFLRELISNASDACDKLRFEALNQPELYEDAPNLEVRVSFDADAKTLTIRDNGIGLSADEAVANLGTIAKSGTREFMAKLDGDQKKDAQLIGQFGVGFYSGFIVADRITVESRRAGAKPERRRALELRRHRRLRDRDRSSAPSAAPRSSCTCATAKRSFSAAGS